jgi:hypothetical protein
MKFGAKPEAEAAILGSIDARVRHSDFDSLRAEAGFSAPNEFPVERLITLLRTRQFPRSDWYEYEWAIYECGFEALERLEPTMRMFLAFIYIYCNKRQQWGITIESDYYWLLIQTARSEPADLSLSFIAWLNDHVSADVGYDDYDCLLSWLMLRRIRGDTSDPMFSAVVETLAKRAYTADQLSVLTVSDRDAASWLSLHRQLPGSIDSATDHTITTLIIGVA